MLANSSKSPPSFRLRRVPPVVAIVGATGAVGSELPLVLQDRNFPMAELRLFASARSASTRLQAAGRGVVVAPLSERSFEDTHLALSSAGSEVACDYASHAVHRGAVVIDNSSAFRLDPHVPLVVPEINPAAIESHAGIITNPNCAVIIALMSVWPIHRENRVRRMILATYQAASGAGAAAMAELLTATRAYLDGQPHQPRVLPHPYAFNLFSHDTAVDLQTGYNDEESKVIAEIRKILGDPDIRIGVTCVRVPVPRAHSIALNIRCEHPIEPAEARAMLSGAPGVRLVDDQLQNYFPMPSDATGQREVLVGRIRRDLSDPSGRSLALFAVGDQLLKGAALNAAQIVEHLIA